MRQWIEMLTGRRPTDTDLKTRDDLISLKMAQKQFRNVHCTTYSSQWTETTKSSTIDLFRTKTGVKPLCNAFCISKMVFVKFLKFWPLTLRPF